MNLLFPRRIGRLSYLIRDIVCALAIEYWVDRGDVSTAGTFNQGPAAWLPIVMLVLYWLVFVIYARSRDVGMRWYWLFLMLVPGANIGLVLVLLFAKSSPVLEQSSPNPKSEPTAHL